MKVRDEVKTWLWLITPPNVASSSTSHFPGVDLLDALERNLRAATRMPRQFLVAILLAVSESQAFTYQYERDFHSDVISSTLQLDGVYSLYHVKTQGTRATLSRHHWHLASQERQGIAIL